MQLLLVMFALRRKATIVKRSCFFIMFFLFTALSHVGEEI
jgi:hypothetical protein